MLDLIPEMMNPKDLFGMGMGAPVVDTKNASSATSATPETPLAPKVPIHA